MHPRTAQEPQELYVDALWQSDRLNVYTVLYTPGHITAAEIA